MKQNKKTAMELLNDYMYNSKSKVSYEDIVNRCREEKLEKRLDNLRNNPIGEIKEILKEVWFGAF